MTNIEQKALELVNEVCRSDFKDLGSTYRNNLLDALCRAIERHEAFRQEVSDAVEAYLAHTRPWPDNSLRRFIIAKPDPLWEVMNEMGFGFSKTASEEICAALAKRGLEIREKE